MMTANVIPGLIDHKIEDIGEKILESLPHRQLRLVLLLLHIPAAALVDTIQNLWVACLIGRLWELVALEA